MHFSSHPHRLTPEPVFPRPLRGTMSNGDFATAFYEASRNHNCAECGSPREYRVRPRSLFCSAKCSLRFRHRRNYWSNPELERERSRRYYVQNREAVLERAAAKRVPRAPSFCPECGEELTGQQRVNCGKSGCREARWKRTNPEAYAAREAKKVERRRERRREGGK